MIGWTRCTRVQYEALGTKKEDEFYYISDEGILFLGEVCYGRKFSVVSEFPTSGAAGVVYINQMTFEVRIWSNGAWSTVGLPKSDAVNASSTNAQLATAKAVYDFVLGELAKIDAGAGGQVADSGKVFGGDAIAATPDGNTLATEKAVAAALTLKTIE